MKGRRQPGASKRLRRGSKRDCKMSRRRKREKRGRTLRRLRDKGWLRRSSKRSMRRKQGGKLRLQRRQLLKPRLRPRRWRTSISSWVGVIHKG